MPLTLSEIMTKRLVSVNASTSLEEAFTLMHAKQIRHLMVVEETSGRLIGLVSDRDIKKLLSPFAGSKSATPQDNATLRVKVGAIMRKDVITGQAEDHVKPTVEKMLQKKLSSIPVVDDEHRCVGIVTTDDIMKLVLRYL